MKCNWSYVKNYFLWFLYYKFHSDEVRNKVIPLSPIVTDITKIISTLKRMPAGYVSRRSDGRWKPNVLAKCGDCD